MNESKPYMAPQGYVDPTSKYYIDRMWEEYHKMKEELADTKSKLAQAEDEIDNWKQKWIVANGESIKFRAYVNRMIPIVDAAQELEHSIADADTVNKVRRAYRTIGETWEDVRARCS